MHDHDVTITWEGDVPPLLPPDGSYEGIFLRATEARFMGSQQKIYLWFRLTWPLAVLNEVVFKAYNKPARHKRAISSHFYRDWVLANGDPPKRGDRMSTRVFKGKIFKLRLRTVATNARQEQLAPEQQYSVIDRLIGVTEHHP